MWRTGAVHANPLLEVDDENQRRLRLLLSTSLSLYFQGDRSENDMKILRIFIKSVGFHVMVDFSPMLAS